MKKGVILLVLITSITSLFALDKSLFEKANTLYKNKAYSEAVALYESLLKQQPQLATLEFNLANAYFKNGELAKAIVHYERAKRLNPDDEDINHNLLYAQSKTADKISHDNAPLPIIAFHKLVSTFSAKGWAFASIAFLWLSAGGFVIWLFYNNIRKVGFYIGAICAFLGCVFFGLGKARYSFENKCGVGVVAVSKVFVKSAPDEASSDLFVLHEGTEVKIRDNVDVYVKVVLLDGKIGWINKSQLLFI